MSGPVVLPVRPFVFAIFPDRCFVQLFRDHHGHRLPTSTTAIPGLTSTDSRFD